MTVASADSPVWRILDWREIERVFTTRTARMEAAQTASTPTGSEEHWGDTKSGRLFNALVEQDFANPVMFIDEIDKTAGGEHGPLMGLFALLEEGIASSFADLSYPWVALDASQVLWACTSNCAQMFPASILDRLLRFDIATPTEQQALANRAENLQGPCGADAKCSGG